jgi:surface polysaccharide O-acyltransferase-like enzyme
MIPVHDAGDRWRAGVRTAARTAGPALAWIAAGSALFGAYGAGTFLLVNNYLGPEHHDGDQWHFWFVEVFVHLVLLTTALVAIPGVRRAERRRPYAFALGVLAVTLVFRYGLVEIGAPANLRFRTHGVAWFFAIGWLVHRSDTVRRKLLTSAIVVAVVPGFFAFPQREWFIVGCVVGLVWWREVRLPRAAVVPLALVSSASLWILITHFTVWPPMVDALGRTAAYPLTIAAGVGAWVIARAATCAAGRRWRARRPITTAPRRCVPVEHAARPVVRLT